MCNGSCTLFWLGITSIVFALYFSITAYGLGQIEAKNRLAFWPKWSPIYWIIQIPSLLLSRAMSFWIRKKNFNTKYVDHEIRARRDVATFCAIIGATFFSAVAFIS
jgi:hypothetical protein